MQLSWMTARRARLGLCAVLAGVFLLAMASPAAPEPAAPQVPDAPTAEDPPEGCEKRGSGDDADEFGGFQFDNFASNGQAYYFCDFGWEDQDDCLIFTYLTDWDGETFCAVDGESIMIKCRNERASFSDEGGGVLVPVDYEERGWGWWVQEIKYESLDETERREGRETDGEEIDTNKNLGAQGCALGAEPPRRDCESVREERIRKLESISSLKAERRDLGSSDSDAARRTEIDGEIEELTQEARDLADIGGIVPDDCWGTHPTSHYGVSWEADDFSLERLMGWIATIAFGFGKMAIGTALWLLGFGFTFDVTQYLSTVSAIASNVDRELVHLGNRGNAFTLFNLAWFALFAYAGLQAIRGRMTRGGMEILVSVGLAALASVFVVSAGGSGSASEGSSFSVWEYATSFGELIDRSSAAMLMLAADDWDINDDLYCPGYLDDEGTWHVDESDPDECNKYIYRETNIRQLVYDNQSRIHEEFVERPYMFINWNQEFGNDACMAAINHSLSTPYSGDGWEQRFLDRVSLGAYDLQDGQLVPVDDPISNPPDCGKMSKFNGEMDVNRMMSAIFVSIVSVTVAVLLGLVAAGLLVVKFLAGLAFALLPVMVVFAVMPNRARGLAWWWLGFIVQLWLGAMALGLMLAFMMWLLDAIYSTTEGMPLAERWIMVLMLMAVLFFVRKQLMSGSQKIAQNITDRMTNITQGGGGGGGGGWVRPGPGAADLGKWSGDRLPGAVGRWAATTGAPMAANYGLAIGSAAAFGTMRAAGTPFRRMAENRVIKKNKRNLERQEVQQARRAMMRGQIQKRQALAREQGERTGKIRGAMAKSEAREQKWFAGREAKRERFLNPVRDRMTDAMNREKGAQRRMATARGQQATLKNRLDPNHARGIKGREATRAARSLGMSQRDIDRWNKMSPYERTRPTGQNGRGPSMADRMNQRVDANAAARIQRERAVATSARKDHAKAQQTYDRRFDAVRPQREADVQRLERNQAARKQGLAKDEARRGRQHAALSEELIRERKDFSAQEKSIRKSERRMEAIRVETPYQAAVQRNNEGVGSWGQDRDKAEIKREAKATRKAQRKRDNKGI